MSIATRIMKLEARGGSGQIPIWCDVETDVLATIDFDDCRGRIAGSGSAALCSLVPDAGSGRVPRTSARDPIMSRSIKTRLKNIEARLSPAAFRTYHRVVGDFVAECELVTAALIADGRASPLERSPIACWWRHDGAQSCPEWTGATEPPSPKWHREAVVGVDDGSGIRLRHAIDASRGRHRRNGTGKTRALPRSRRCQRRP